MSKTFRELANLVAGALVLGQFVREQSLSLRLVFAGVATWVVLVGLALLLAEERSNG